MSVLFTFFFHCFIGIAAHNYDVGQSDLPEFQIDHETENKKELLGLLEKHEISETPLSNKPILKLASRTRKEANEVNNEN